MTDGLDWSSYKRAVDNYDKLLKRTTVERAELFTEEERIRLQLDLFILKMQPQYILALGLPNREEF